MKAFFGLFRRFILRAMLRRKLRSAITALGIALGVGVMIAIRLANASSLESFKVATSSVAGQTSLEIVGSAGRFDEMLLTRIDWLRDYGEISPIIDGYALEQDSTNSGSGEFLHVLGVDILHDRELRKYELLDLTPEHRPSSARDFLLLLADPHAIVLTERFARKHALNVGSSISLVIGDSRKQFTVRGLLLDEGPARALDGRIALMDIAAAQWAFDRLGLLDRLDLKLKPERDLSMSEKEIAARLPPALAVRQPNDGYGAVERMIGAFHFNLSALASIALLVGLFLIYNTVSTSVISRREEIGMLRAVGVTSRTVLFLFIAESLLFAITGTGCGLALGQVMASGAVHATAATVDTFYIAAAATAESARQHLGIWDAGVGFAIALPLSFIAAAMPALEAARVEPVEAIRGSERLTRSVRPPARYLAVAATLFAAGYGLSQLGPVGGLPIMAYIAACALVFGGAFLVPYALWLTCKSVSILPSGWPGWAKPFRIEQKLAGANLGGAVPRVSISVAALAVALAMMTAVSIMIGSFRETVSYWVDQTLGADIYAKSVTRETSLADGEVSYAALAAVKSDPDVAAVDSYTAQSANYQGRLITLAAADFDVVLKHGRLMFKEPGDARDRLRDAIGQDQVVVSESFSLYFAKKPGDTVELPTPAGPHWFRVAAVYYDYSNNRGVAVMDRSTYERLFRVPGSARLEPPSSLSIYLRPDADPGTVSGRLQHQLAAKYQIVFSTNRTVRREITRIFDSTFSITYALEAIATTVAALGVLSTLITLFLERKREIGVLRVLGATRRQVRRIIVIEAVLIGSVSQLIGVLIGVALSLVLVYVVNVQSFGWTIQYHFPLAFIVESSLLLVLFAAAAGLYPARLAARTEAVSLVREE